MSRGPGRPNAPLRWSIILGGVALIVAVLVWLSAPNPQRYLAGAASQSVERACGYDQARRSAEQAAQAYDRARIDRAPTRAREVEANAAARRAEDAKQCEERARNRADLDAQWRSAFAAENTFDAAQKLRFLAIFEIALLVATVAAAFMALFDARKHSERELRAYMCDTNPHIIEHVSNGAVFGREFALHWKNTGATPARRSHTQTTVISVEKDKPYGPEKIDFAEAKLINPGSVTGIGPSETSLAKTGINSAYAKLMAGTHRVYVWSWIEYRDIFADTPLRRSEYCAEIVRDGDEQRGWRLLFRTYHLFNGFDEDCYRKAGEPAPETPKDTIGPELEGRVA